MSARHKRNSLAPVAAQIDDVFKSIQDLASDVTEMKEGWIEFMTETRHRLEALEKSVTSRAVRGDKIRLSAIASAIGASVSAGIGLLLNALL